MAVIIDELTKQRIRDAAKIFDVVGDFVSLRRKGADYVGLCPFHSDRNPSFHVSVAKNFCKCFSCGEGGNPINFIMKHEQLTYVEALKYLAHKYGIPLEEREETDEERRMANERQSLFVINEYASDYFHDQLLHSTQGQDIGLSYFKERGIRTESISKFALGYSSGARSDFSDSALQKGYRKDFLITTGLSLSYEDGKPLADRFRDRIIFPIHSISGKVVGFGGRILTSRDKIAKYINSPESPIYSKSRELYGLYQAKRSISREDRCYLVEGYLDVIQMHQSGIDNVVSSSGTALTDGQIRLIYRFTRNVTLLYDGDAAGIKAAMRGVDMLLAAGMQIKIVLLPDGEDPDSFARSCSSDEFKAYISEHEQDFIGFKTDRLLIDTAEDPIERARVINDIIGSISLIPDAISRSVYIQSTAQRLMMDEALLLDEVNKRKRNPRAYAQGSPSAYSSPNHSPTYGRSAVDSISNNPTSPPTTYDSTITTSPISLSPTPSLTNPTKESTRSSVLSGSRDSLPSPTAESVPPTASTLPPYEAELIRLILRDGGKTVELQQNHTEAEQQEDVKASVALAVLVYEEFALEQALCSFVHPVTLQIITEAASLASTSINADTEVYFLDHTDPVINKLSLDMLFEKYTPSRLLQPQPILGNTPEEIQKGQEREMHNLFNRTVRAIYDVRNAYVLGQIRSVQHNITEAQRMGRTNEMPALLSKLGQLGEVKRLLSKELGDRTII